MNYYAQGGQAHGLKSIAQELQDMGRGGDTILAHINPQEAALLKRLGGSGTINPATGLPEFIKIGGSLGKMIEKPFRSDGIIGNALSPVTDLIRDLGPVGTIAAAYFGGPIGAGIVGGLQGEKGFDLKRALLSGAMAYGAQNLAEGLSNAGGSSSFGGGTPSISVDDAGVALLPADAAATASIGSTAVPPVVFDDAGTALLPADRVAMEQGIASLGDKVSNFASQAGQNVSEGISQFGSKAGDVLKGGYNLATNAPGAAEAFKASGITMSNTALPLYMGTSGIAALDEAERMKLESDLANAKSQEEYNAIMDRIEASKQRGITAMQENPYQFALGGFVNTAVPSIKAAVEALPSVDARVDLQRAIADANAANPFREANQRLIAESIREMSQPRVLPQQPVDVKKDGIEGRPDFSSFGGAIGRIMNRINEPKEFENTAKAALQANPFQFAYGGSVDDSSGKDDLSAAGIADAGLGNLQRGLRFAQGGQPRFLSGGGDGMSDDIPATINGKQPARLADGEFVIPADVVSHLGNGSSKAGAKKLYSMMDKVRHARTGNKKQGKQINPSKFMPA